MGPSLCMFLYQSYSPRILYNTHVVPGCLDLTLIARFRTATHHNMMLDPAILCSSSSLVAIIVVDIKTASAFPHHRILHYWSKGRNSPVHM